MIQKYNHKISVVQLWVWLVCAIFTLIIMTPTPAMAEFIPPHDSEQTLTTTYDFNDTDPIYIDTSIPGAGDSDNPDRWGLNGFVCLSATDTRYGACPYLNIDKSGVRMGYTPVLATFKEKRSGISFVTTVYFTWQYRTIATFSGYMYFSFNRSQTGIDDKGNPGYTKLLKLATPPDMFPFGGVWEGTLKIQERDSNNQPLALHTVHVEVNAIDSNHIDIYFPEFGTAAPLVPLNIHPTGGASPTPGSQDVTNLDMCLYDGFNVNSSKYEVLLEDGNHHTPAGRPMGLFSVYRDGGDENQPRDRIDYQVRMNNPETDAMMDVRNGELITWNAVNTHRVRPVRLPSISYPVLCAPTPLEFRVNKFATADKNAGQYHGTLRVTFTPTTTTL